MARKKIYPVLWWLYRDNLLPKNTTIHGFARSKMDLATIRAKCDPYMKLQPEEQGKFEEFWKLNHYLSGQYDAESSFNELNQHLEKFEAGGKANRLFYLALPPSVFEAVTVHIRNLCMNNK